LFHSIGSGKLRALALIIVLLVCSSLLFGGGLKEHILEGLSSKGLHPLLVVFLLSTLPIFELRLGIPIGINYFHLPWWHVVPVSILGNLVPVVPLLLFLEPVSSFLSKWRPGKIFFDWLFARTRRRSRVVERYESLGLVIFVGVPLPITGAWTGCVAAFLFGLPFLRSFVCIGLGVMVASVIVTTLSLMGTLGAVVAGVALLLLVGFGVWRFG